MATAVAVAAVAAVVVPLTGPSHGGARVEITVASPSTQASGPFTASGITPPAAITVDGSEVPYVGTVPWSDAVAPSSASTTLTIYADGDQIGHEVCGLPTERVEVHQDAQTVQVLVAGYAHPLPAGTACSGVGHLPQPLTVHLTEPLGGRRVVDASTNTTRRVLAAFSVPTLAGVPTGFAQFPVTWDEKTGEVNRNWRTAPLSSSSMFSLITLTRASAGVIESHDGPPTPTNPDGPNGTLVASAVPVAGGAARVWDHTDRYQHIVTVRWTTPDGLEHQLLTSTPPGGSLGVPQAEALARSVH